MFRRMCNTAGKFAVLIALVAMSYSMPPSANAENEALDFTLINKSGRTIAAAYMREYTEEKDGDWGPDWLTDYVLEDGQETRMNFNPNRDAQRWDMKVVFGDDGSEAIGYGFNLHDTLSLTVEYRKGKLFITYKTVN